MDISNIGHFVNTAVENVKTVANEAIGSIKKNWPTFKFEALTKLSSIKDSMVENFGKLTRSVVKRFNPDAGARMSMEYHAKKLEESFLSVDSESQEKVGQAISSLSDDQSLSTEAKTKILKTLDEKFAKELLDEQSDKTTKDKLKDIANRLSNEIKMQSIVAKSTDNKEVYESNKDFINAHRTPETFVNAFFEQNEQFKIPDDIKAARNFFNPTTFTTEERQEIVKQLETKKTQNPQTDDDKFNNLKIDMMIAQFTEPWDEELTQKFKIFDGLTKDVINILESNIDEAMNIDDSTGTITMKNFLKNPEEIAQKLSYIKDITLVFNQFQSPNESFQNSAIRNGNTMIVQQYPRLELLIKEACQPNNSPGHIDRVLNEAKTTLIDFEHAKKAIFIAKKCSEFIEKNKTEYKDKKDKDKDKKQTELEAVFLTQTTEVNQATQIINLTPANKEEVNRLAQALGYQESQ